jgi:hypothetical protein
MQLTERQKHHQERMAAHEATQNMLVKILECLLSEHNRQKNLAERRSFDEMVAISASIPIVLDYRERKHIYIFSAQSLTLSLEDMGQIALTPGTWEEISFRPGLNIYAIGQTATVYVAVKQTETPLFPTADIPSVSPALVAFAGNVTQTASGAADTTYKFGAAGNTYFNHVSMQNNGTINIIYAFDQDSTHSTNPVYILAPGQFVAWDRSGQVMHFNSAAQVAFNTSTGITVEAFA